MTAGRAAFEKKDYGVAAAQARLAMVIRAGDADAARLKTDAERAQQEIAGAAEADAKYKQAMTAGRAAYEQKNYANAVAQAHAALSVRPGDAEAAKLIADAQAPLAELAARAERDTKYQQAMKAAQTAFEQKDYAGAIVQAGTALGLRPADAAALKLKSDAEQQQKGVAAAVDVEAKYNDIMLAGKAALKRQNFAYAMTQANAALAMRPNDPDAVKLKEDIGRGEKYKDAMEAGQAALERKDYAGAIAQANTALGIRTNDTVATQLKSDAELAQKELAAQADRETKYQQAMDSGQSALAAKKYDDARRFATVALSLKPNDSEAARLKAAAQPPAATAEELDRELRNLMIETRVKPQGPQVLTNGGTATAKSDAFLLSSQSLYLKRIEDLENAYRSLKGLDAERQKDIKKIKDAIPY